jgi:signal transduction histidine kinase
MMRSDAVNILMVDDQPGKLLSYEAILDELGENLIKVSSAREALEQLLKNDIAVVLLDVSMPEIDGFELANLIRQHPRYQRTAIIFISGVHFSDLDKIRGYQRGAADYIAVPVVPELLRAKVSIFVELHRKTRELENVNSELRGAQENLRHLTGRLMQIQDDERRRIARDVHDGLGQYLAAVKMGIDQLSHHFVNQPICNERLQDISEVLDRAISESRTLSHLLHPPLLDEIGLSSALSQYVHGFAKRSGVLVDLDIPADLGRLGKDTEIALFRVTQECLTNVHRHSQSSRASVSIRRETGKIRMEVRDEGVGMTLLKPDDNAFPGIGILGIQARVRQLNGNLEISSSEGKGTSISVLIPEEQAVQESASS